MGKLSFDIGQKPKTKKASYDEEYIPPYVPEKRPRARKRAVQAKIDKYFPDRKVVPGARRERAKKVHRVQTSLDQYLPLKPPPIQHKTIVKTKVRRVNYIIDE